MRCAITATVAFLSIGVGCFGLLADQTGSGKKTDQERLIGTWRTITVQARGKATWPPEMVKLVRLKFGKDGKLTLLLLDERFEDRKYFMGEPGQLDIQANYGPQSNGVFLFHSDDRLTISLTNFFDANMVLLVLERSTPDEEKKITAEERAKAKAAAIRLRQALERTISMYNLSSIGRAMHLYHDQFQRFPFHAIYSKDGKIPLLSWRVAILPFLDDGEVYKEFKLDEAWDSPHNKKLIAKMPRTYQPVGMGKKDEGLTYYQVFSGPDTVFNGTKEMRMPRDFPDGVTQTLLAIEAKEPVIWTKPADLTLPKGQDKMPAVGGLFLDVTNAVMCDASVMSFATNKLTPSVVRAIVTPNGGEVVDLDKLGK